MREQVSGCSLDTNSVGKFRKSFLAEACNADRITAITMVAVMVDGFMRDYICVNWCFSN